MTFTCTHDNASSAPCSNRACVWTPSSMGTDYYVGTSLQKGTQFFRGSFRNSGLLNHMIKMVLWKNTQVATCVHHPQNATIIQHHNFPLLGHAFDVAQRWSRCRCLSNLCLSGGLWAANWSCQHQALVDGNDKMHFGHHESCIQMVWCKWCSTQEVLRPVVAPLQLQQRHHRRWTWWIIAQRKSVAVAPFVWKKKIWPKGWSEGGSNKGMLHIYVPRWFLKIFFPLFLWWWHHKCCRRWFKSWMASFFHIETQRASTQWSSNSRLDFGRLHIYVQSNLCMSTISLILIQKFMIVFAWSFPAQCFGLFFWVLFGMNFETSQHVADAVVPFDAINSLFNITKGDNYLNSQLRWCIDDGVAGCWKCPCLKVKKHGFKWWTFPFFLLHRFMFDLFCLFYAYACRAETLIKASSGSWTSKSCHMLNFFIASNFNLAAEWGTEPSVCQCDTTEAGMPTKWFLLFVFCK